jgi:hypothetical protein
MKIADFRESGKKSGVLCGSEQRRGWLKDRVEGRYRGQRKVCYFLYARDRLKVGGVMRHDVAGRASIGRDQCGLVRMLILVANSQSP